MNVKSGFYFSTLGDVLKLRSIFHRPNVARNENAAFNIVYSTYMTPYMSGGEPRRHFWFLKLGKSLEASISREEMDTPVIVWKSVDKTYSKIQVEKLDPKEGRTITTYPVFIGLDEKRLTVAFGGKIIMRVSRRELQFSDITLRNISRAAGREFIFRKGLPVVPVDGDTAVIFQSATTVIGEVLGQG